MSTSNMQRPFTMFITTLRFGFMGRWSYNMLDFCMLWLNFMGRMRRLYMMWLRCFMWLSMMFSFFYFLMYCSQMMFILFLNLLMLHWSLFLLVNRSCLLLFLCLVGGFWSMDNLSLGMMCIWSSLMMNRGHMSLLSMLLSFFILIWNWNVSDWLMDRRGWIMDLG